MHIEKLHRTVEHFRTLCEVNPKIVVGFVGGSLATGTADEYSDLDLYLITQDNEYDNFFAERMAFIQQLGEPVFLEDFNGFGFDMVLFILKGGVKGELAMAKASHFLHIHNGPYRVLVDKISLLKGVTFSEERIPPEEQRRNLEKLIRSFWRHLYLITGALGRGHLLSAMSFLEGLRQQLLRICRLSVNFADSGGHPRLEVMLTPSLVEGLSRTFPHLERKEMVRAVTESVQLFQRLAQPLAKAHGIAYPTLLEHEVLKRFKMVTGVRVKKKCKPTK